MAYQTLSTDKQDDMLVATLAAQEADLFSHTINKQRFETMLLTLPAGEFRNRVGQLLADTINRLTEVASILDALTTQLPDQTRIDAAKKRLGI